MKSSPVGKGGAPEGDPGPCIPARSHSRWARQLNNKHCLAAVLITRDSTAVGSANGICQRSERINRHRDRVSLLQEFRRVEADADADRSAGGDEVARLERYALRERLYQCRDVEDQIGDFGVLA